MSGDEVFGGHDRYVEHLGRTWTNRLPRVLKQGLLGSASGLLPERTPGKRLLHNLSLAAADRYVDSVSYLKPRTLSRLLGRDLMAQFDADRDAWDIVHARGSTTSTVSAQIQALDFKTYLAGDILVKVDRMSMANSLEARVPLLDHKLVERVTNLDESLKVRGGTGKRTS